MEGESMIDREAIAAFVLDWNGYPLGGSAQGDTLPLMIANVLSEGARHRRAVTMFDRRQIGDGWSAPGEYTIVVHLYRNEREKET